jgi:hypothetical protein
LADLPPPENTNYEQECTTGVVPVPARSDGEIAWTATIDALRLWNGLRELDGVLLMRKLEVQKPLPRRRHNDHGYREVDFVPRVLHSYYPADGQ